MKSRPAITDMDNNTYLLQAAQPTHISQRAGALANLKNRLKAGTLVIKEVPAETANKVYTAQEPAGTETKELEEVQVDWNEDLIFDILGSSRKEVVSFFAEAKGTELLKNFHLEIFSYLKYLQTSNRVNFSRDKNFGPYFQAEETLQKFMAEAAQQFPFPPQLLQDPEKLLMELKATREKINNKEGHIKFLEGAINHHRKSHQQALEACKTEQKFTMYLQDFEKYPIALGPIGIMIYAEAHQIPIIIWSKQEGTNQLKSDWYSLVGADKKFTIHLLQEAGAYQPFKMLVPYTSNELTEALGSEYLLKLEKEFKPLEEVNAWFDNLLHRAVRCVAADILVPYLLTEVGFAGLINARNKFGKIALHRAIFYIAENAAQQGPQFATNGINFVEMGLKCFEILIAAGSDITAQAYQIQDTPLARARIYQSQILPDNSIILETWLMQMKQKYLTSEPAPAIQQVPLNAPPVLKQAAHTVTPLQLHAQRPQVQPAARLSGQPIAPAPVTTHKRAVPNATFAVPVPRTPTAAPMPAQKRAKPSAVAAAQTTATASSNYQRVMSAPPELPLPALFPNAMLSGNAVVRDRSNVQGATGRSINPPPDSPIDDISSILQPSPAPSYDPGTPGMSGL